MKVGWGLRGLRGAGDNSHDRSSSGPAKHIHTPRIFAREEKKIPEKNSRAQFWAGWSVLDYGSSAFFHPVGLSFSFCPCILRYLCIFNLCVCVFEYLCICGWSVIDYGSSAFSHPPPSDPLAIHCNPSNWIQIKNK